MTGSENLQSPRPRGGIVDSATCVIRLEMPGDETAIRDVTQAAFANLAHADGTEAEIAPRLRADGDLLLSIVAVQADKLVGHAAASPALLNREPGWVAMGPVAVAPDLHRQGIGAAMIQELLGRLRQAPDILGVLVMGDPAYYWRFGFAGDIGLTYPGVPARYLQGMAFGAALPHGEITFARAFSED